MDAGDTLRGTGSKVGSTWVVRFGVREREQFYSIYVPSGTMMIELEVSPPAWVPPSITLDGSISEGIC